AIDSTLAEPLLDTHSAIREIVNGQVIPKESRINPIKLKEYEDFKDIQKKIKKNFNASRFLCDEPLSRQPKKKAKEVFEKADFILCDWLALYCNSMESILDQDDINELTNYIQDSDFSISIINIPKKVKQAKKKTDNAKTKKHALLLPKKNTQPSINTSNEDSDSENASQDNRDKIEYNSVTLTPAIKPTRSIRFSMQDVTNNESSDSSNTQDSNNLAYAINAFTQDSGTSNNMSPTRLSLKTNLRSSAQKHTGLAKSSLERNLQSSAQKHIDIENMTKQDNTIESNTQKSSTLNNTGKKQKGEQKIKETEAGVNKRTKTKTNKK
ncbi:10353_t:CDS:10, partial [Gigaspora margarita]